jgi:hypothetical protein
MHPHGSMRMVKLEHISFASDLLRIVTNGPTNEQANSAFSRPQCNGTKGFEASIAGDGGAS